VLHQPLRHDGVGIFSQRRDAQKDPPKRRATQ